MLYFQTEIYNFSIDTYAENWSSRLETYKNDVKSLSFYILFPVKFWWWESQKTSEVLKNVFTGKSLYEASKEEPSTTYVPNFVIVDLMVTCKTQPHLMKLTSRRYGLQPPVNDHHKTVLLQTRILPIELRKSTAPIRKDGHFYKESKGGLLNVKPLVLSQFVY
jgi:hypothetical protein